MPLKLAQFQYQEGAEHGDVTPENDAELFHNILRSCHMIRPVTVTALGGNQLLFHSGSGVVYGRFFEVSEETRAIPISPSGDLPGRTVIRIDIGNAAEPIQWLHQSGASLPTLVQEDLQAGGAVFDVPVCTYTVSTLAISDLTMTPLTGGNLVYRDDVNIADLAYKSALDIPNIVYKNTIATDRTGSVVRNINVQNSSGTNVSTCYILARRK